MTAGAAHRFRAGAISRYGAPPRWLALVVAAGAHLAVLAMLVRIPPRPPPVAAVGIAEAPVIDLMARSPEPPPVAAAAPTGRSMSEAPRSNAPPTPIEAVAPIEGAPGPDVAPAPASVRLEPRLGDPGLWRVLDAAPHSVPSDEFQPEVDANVDLFRDSLAEARAAERERLTWTRADSTGSQWGISPGRIHLGRFTVPLRWSSGDRAAGAPIPGAIFTGPRDRGAQQRRLDEVESQAGRARTRNAVRERARLMRERGEVPRDTVRGPRD